jgi:T-complex protein 1 subunit gamma
MQQPVLVMNQNAQRESGNKAQIANITAARAISDIIRSTLGPRSMLKMLLDPMGIIMTNDGNSILREVDVAHPAAKSMIELSRTQDEEVGDGTTSVIVLAGEILKVSTDFFERNIHPTIICQGYMRALEDAIKVMEDIAVEIDSDDNKLLDQIVDAAVGTKFSARFGTVLRTLAIQAVKTVAIPTEDGEMDIDIKRYARIEKIPGGDIEDSYVLSGCMINKDVLHHKMPRNIVNPRVLLLDCPLEYKKGESQTNVEITKEEDFEKMLQIEENCIKEMCDVVIGFKPTVVITEKGVSDLAVHFLVKAGITCLRRLRKTDNNRLAKCTGATIVNKVDEIQESDIGTKCGLYKCEKLGDEWWSYFVECEDPKACTILLRGGTRDTQYETARNINDAMQVARNVLSNPKLLPGGGATEMAISQALKEKAKSVEGIAQIPYAAISEALEIIPQTLAENCGANVIRVVTAMRAKHANKEGSTWGIDGHKGTLADMAEIGIWEPFVVKSQSIKTAIESACMLLRIDDIHSGISRKDKGGGGGPTEEQQKGEEHQS